MKDDDVRNSVFSFDCYLQFLNQFHKSKSHSSSTWTLGVWARELGFKNTASISRILSGDRVPSRENVEKFCSYFNFDFFEIEYFDLLVSQKRKSLPPSVQKLVNRRVLGLKSENKKGPPFHLEGGKFFQLMGSTDINLATQAFEPQGLEPVSISGVCPTYLSFCDYFNSDLGPYREFYTATLVKPLKGTVADIGLVYNNLFGNSSDITAYGSLDWGQGYDIADINFESLEMAELKVGSESLVRFVPREPLVLHPDSPEVHHDFNGIGTNRGFLSLYKITMTATELGQEYMAKKDILEINSAALKSWLESVGFVPLRWEIRQLISAKVDRPHSWTKI